MIGVGQNLNCSAGARRPLSARRGGAALSSQRPMKRQANGFACFFVKGAQSWIKKNGSVLKWWAGSCGGAIPFSRRSARKGTPRRGIGNSRAARSKRAKRWKRPLRACQPSSPTASRLWRTVEHDYPLRSVRVHFFHITDYSGEPIANERQAFLWVTPQEARDLPFLEADRPLLPLLKRP